MIWLWLAACGVLATLLLARRREMASLQSMIAGGRILPGCIVAEAIGVLAMGFAVLVAWWAGLLE